jgi:hypothetical protein
MRNQSECGPGDGFIGHAPEVVPDGRGGRQEVLAVAAANNGHDNSHIIIERKVVIIQLSVGYAMALHPQQKRKHRWRRIAFCCCEFVVGYLDIFFLYI